MELPSIINPELFWRRVRCLLFAFYVFMIPMYYYHFKESHLELRDRETWNSDDDKRACIAAIFWPTAIVFELAFCWQEYKELHKAEVDRIKADRKSFREKSK